MRSDYLGCSTVEHTGIHSLFERREWRKVEGHHVVYQSSGTLWVSVREKFYY